ncbi:MAG: hypothetical protein FJ194_15615 [Gammaproteobacteria bacterium]|nr:hypothetical protein [Gammaproteobacteria bacterium]
MKGTTWPEAACVAVDYLFYSGYAVVAWLWARMALTAERLRQSSEPEQILHMPLEKSLSPSSTTREFYRV